MAFFLGNTDQVMVLAREAADQDAVIQVLWSYDRPIKISQVRAFHQRLCAGPLSRRITRKRLPIGRDRWRWQNGLEQNLTIGTDVLSSSQMTAWMDDEVERPLDPFEGPGWRLSCQCFDNGKTIAALTISHCIADGANTLRAVDSAVTNHVAIRQSREHPEEASLLQELKQILQDCWDCIRTLPSLAVLGMRGMVKLIPSSIVRKSSRPYPSVREQVQRTKHDAFTRLTTLSVSIPMEDWHEACRRTRSTTLSLIIRIIGSIALDNSRYRHDRLSLMIPMGSKSQESEDAANTVRLARIAVPTHLFVGDDLRELRKLLNAALVKARREPDFYESVLPVVPFIPMALFKRLYNAVTQQELDLPISVSHMGVLPDSVLSLDGLPADDFCCRGVDRFPRTGELERRGGVLTILSTEVDGRMILNFISHQVGRDNSWRTLRDLALRTITKLQMSCSIFPRDSDSSIQPQP